ncbi:DUF2567 domain-containing protein [Nakamurella multipartita]|uniref:DUF2567 domain-containing protein n=1 Tax=Nakamurella multipartita (strain ATCC 700099 / DSM 44233 / CIP 104796 / JCM 9543 / NBRC 105858 / Y-104) TaxID=479431 RepID=C8XBZ9_NAKMY|nr:DUF2567 domain-containing protein [Nakamurella multipartita]ACV79503.1 hypothetical protein Namu_3171 [Nakamurella multipartita DSM 44233]
MTRAARVVLIGAGAAGVLQGLLWAFLAPGVPYKVLADGRYGALPSTTSYHFVALALFCWLGIIVGVLTAVLAWRARTSRGWPMLLTVVGASFAGSLIAWGLGRLIAPGTDPASVGASAADSIVVSAPSTGTILAVLAQPVAAALVYTFLVAWNGRPDLSVPATPPPADCRQSA